MVRASRKLHCPLTIWAKLARLPVSLCWLSVKIGKGAAFLQQRRLPDGWRGFMAAYWPYAQNIYAGRKGDFSCGHLAFSLDMVDRGNRYLWCCRPLSCSAHRHVAYGLFAFNPRLSAWRKARNPSNGNPVAQTLPLVKEKLWQSQIVMGCMIVPKKLGKKKWWR